MSESLSDRCKLADELIAALDAEREAMRAYYHAALSGHRGERYRRDFDVATANERYEETRYAA